MKIETAFLFNVHKAYGVSVINKQEIRLLISPERAKDHSIG